MPHGADAARPRPRGRRNRRAPARAQRQAGRRKRLRRCRHRPRLRERRCRRRICPDSKISSAGSPTRSRHCGVRASRKRSMRCAPNSARSAIRSTRRCRAARSKPSKSRSQDLTQRIAEGRQAGVDSSALAGIEHGLAEVRDALARPDAGGKSGRLHRRDGRARAQDRSDRRRRKTRRRCSNSKEPITTLRELAAHVASNETVEQLAAEVQSLARKVDHIARSGATGRRARPSRTAHRCAAARWPSARKPATRCRRAWRR